MRKLFVVAFLFISIISPFLGSAKTIVTVGSYSITLDENYDLPDGGVYNVDDPSYNPNHDLETFSWGFRVSWHNDNGSGSFDAGGSGDGSWDIFCNWLLAFVRWL